MVKSVHDLSVQVAAGIAGQLDQKEQGQVLAYGLEVLLGILIKAAVVISLSWVLGILVPVIVIFVVEAGFRLVSGGTHCTAYYRCLIASSLVLLALGGLSGPAAAWLGAWPWILSLGALAVFFMTWKYAPVVPPQRSFSAAQKLSRHYWSLIFVLGWFILISFVAFPATWVAASLLAMLWQSFSLTPAGEKFIAGVDFLLALPINGREVKKDVVPD